MRKIGDIKALVFLMGMGCFFLSQPLTRLQLLKVAQGSVSVSMAIFNHFILYLVILAITAGLFEEISRFAFKKFLMKPDKSFFWQPVVFGLGHGVGEALLLLGPYLLSHPISDLYLGILERILTIGVHIGLTVVVWNGFQKGKPVKYLVVAILIHGAIDFVVVILARVGLGPLMLEGVIFLMFVVAIIYVFKSKKLYLRKGGDYGKEEIYN